MFSNAGSLYFPLESFAKLDICLNERAMSIGKTLSEGFGKSPSEDNQAFYRKASCTILSRESPYSLSFHNRDPLLVYAVMPRKLRLTLKIVATQLAIHLKTAV